MKEIKGDEYDVRTRYYDYYVNGVYFWIQGELFRNVALRRWEHTHFCDDGTEILVYWPFKDDDY